MSGSAVESGQLPSHEQYLALARFPSLDGLRALSIVPVVFHHSTPHPFSGVWGKGPLGVHLFFAISGFLITTLLVRERARHGGISLARFYARRSLRIFPLYYLVLGLYVVRALLFLEDSPIRAHFFRSLPFYLSYTGNWFVDYSVPHPVIFGFSWSLATEEQFYLFWPPVLALLAGRRLPILVLVALLGLDLGTEHGLLAAVMSTGGRAERIVTSISAPIALGALLALLLDEPKSFGWVSRALGWRFSAATCLLLLLLAVALDAPLVAIHVLMVALVGAVSLRPDHLLAWIFELRPVRYLGEVSYGIYLWHVSAITTLRWLWPAAPLLVSFPLALLLATAIAGLSYGYFERPFLAWKRRFERVSVSRAADRIQSTET